MVAKEEKVVLDCTLEHRCIECLLEHSWTGMKLFLLRRDVNTQGGKWRFRKGQARMKKLIIKDKERGNQDHSLGRRSASIGDIY